MNARIAELKKRRRALEEELRQATREEYPIGATVRIFDSRRDFHAKILRYSLYGDPAELIVVNTKTGRHSKVDVDYEGVDVEVLK